MARRFHGRTHCSVSSMLHGMPRRRRSQGQAFRRRPKRAGRNTELAASWAVRRGSRGKQFGKRRTLDKYATPGKRAAFGGQCTSVDRGFMQ